jgi:DNA-binding PadR family transcriptional regulator
VRKLTTTSYAILGLLGLRPWSAYELTKQVKRSLHFCWPRAETRLYQEPKNLVEHGLAKATVATQGRRSRTVYSITPRGRKALRRWLEKPSAPPRFESEALLRLFFAEHGTKDGLLATLAELEAQAGQMRAQALVQGSEYLGDQALFPERIHILGLVGKFVLDQTNLVADWARWARAGVECWPDVGQAKVSPEAVEAFRIALASTGSPPDREG